LSWNILTSISLVAEEDWEDEIDWDKLTAEKIKAVLSKEEPYYPVIPGCDNPYRDGYVTEPPKKPRASYLFFQCSMRSYFAQKNPDATQGELMSLLGNHWQSMSEAQRAPFVTLSEEEGKQYEKERQLLEKAQKPNEMWQPLRRCLMVLDRVSSDGFASIFLEPVDVNEFSDYEEVIDQPMDLGTVRTNLKNKKYQSPEQFARDVRKVSTRTQGVWICLQFSSSLTTLGENVRFGTTARYTISTAQRSGMSLIICRRCSNVFIMHGSLSLERGTFVGLTPRLDLGRIRAVKPTENAILLIVVSSCAITATHHIRLHV